jgi:hypothetical protein
MADIIGFPGNGLLPHEQERLEAFMREELADIQDTGCDCYEDIQGEIVVLVEYFRKFMAVVEDGSAKRRPDLDFSLFLLAGRIGKIRGMLKSLYGSGPA